MPAISILKKASSRDLKDLNVLMDQMSRSAHSAHRLSLAELRGVLRDKNVTVLVVRDGKRIIATGTLTAIPTMIGMLGRLEDVVVDEGYRGKGLGEKISRYLLVLAKKKKAISIELTSHPSRAAAIALYEKIGFKKHETNVYRLPLA